MALITTFDPSFVNDINQQANATTAIDWIRANVDPTTVVTVTSPDGTQTQTLLQAEYLSESKWLASDQTGDNGGGGGGQTPAPTSLLSEVGTVAGIGGAAGQAKNLFGGASAAQQTLNKATALANQAQAQVKLDQIAVDDAKTALDAAKQNPYPYSVDDYDLTNVSVAQDQLDDATATLANDTKSLAALQKTAADDAVTNASSKGLMGQVKTFLNENPYGAALEGAGAGFAFYEGWGDLQDLVNHTTTKKILTTAVTLAGAGYALSMFLSNTWVANTLFSFIPYGAFWTFLTSPWGIAAIVAIIVLAAVLTALLGKTKEAPATPTAAAINAAVTQLNSVPWYSGISSASLGVLATGITVLGTSYSLSPGNLTQTSPQINTAQLYSQINSELQATSGQATPSTARYFVLSGAGANGSDLVYLVTPQSNGTSTLTMYNATSGGYLVGSNGNPALDYPPIFAAQVTNGQIAGVTKNTAALNAFEQIPGCVAGAQNAAALNGCTAYKGVTATPG